MVTGSLVDDGLVLKLTGFLLDDVRDAFLVLCLFQKL